MTVVKAEGKVFVDLSCPISVYYLSISLKVMRKTTKGFNRHNRPPGRESNPVPSECEAGVPVIHLKRSFKHNHSG